MTCYTCCCCCCSLHCCTQCCCWCCCHADRRNITPEVFGNNRKHTQFTWKIIHWAKQNSSCSVFHHLPVTSAVSAPSAITLCLHSHLLPVRPVWKFTFGILDASGPLSLYFVNFCCGAHTTSHNKAKWKATTTTRTTTRTATTKEAANLLGTCERWEKKFPWPAKFKW